MSISRWLWANSYAWNWGSFTHHPLWQKVARYKTIMYKLEGRADTYVQAEDTQPSRTPVPARYLKGFSSSFCFLGWGSSAATFMLSAVTSPRFTTCDTEYNETPRQDDRTSLSLSAALCPCRPPLPLERISPIASHAVQPLHLTTPPPLI